MDNLLEKIEKVVKEDHRIAYKDLEGYQEQIKGEFEKLFKYKAFIEKTNLTTYWWESCTKTKYYLKELALIDSNIPEAFREATFYDWLKICINPQKEINYDFYFEKNELDKEDQVKQILFENDRKGKQLREIFKKPDWQIRLKTISDWFLKRYDIDTARKILKNIQSPYKSIFDKVRLFIPRLWGAIFIGFLPLLVGQETWNLPLQLGWGWIIFLSLLFLVFSYLYLTIECYNIIHNIKKAFTRAQGVFLRGFLISLIFSLIIVFIMGKELVGVEYKESGWHCLYNGLCTGRLMFSENVLFFASAALLIGIFIQVFWEEKTITEPL
ncbi:MAG: hypothetical protein IBX72_13895 [Nitrospirae bacterium]|nr:hypothetical protein [Nitrospirota bacterium]